MPGFAIRRLELEDFKSFAGRTTVSFPPGVCVVVGRNGSGKSNLVDALRWVMGEQDLASLRVRDPAGLISRDEQLRRRARRARVTVHLQPSDGGQGVTAARKIDAGGAESYTLDGREAGRGRFLHELRGLGVPVPLATVIRQGDVARLLWLHPEERTRLLTRTVMPGRGDLGTDSELLSARALVREARLEREQLVEALAAIEADLETARRTESLYEEARERRARLLTSLAPHPDDPLLRPLLGALGLASVEGDAGRPAENARLVEALPESMGAGTASPEFLESRRALASARLEQAAERLALLEAAEGVRIDESRSLSAARAAEFSKLHERLESRFAGFFTTLVGGGEVALPLVPPGPLAELPGIGISARFPAKPLVPLDALSGGQLVVLGLCLALAVFLEIPSPALVLDEVEPALDEALVRRLTRLLADVGQERQVIAVSHQALMRYTAGQVMHVERKGGVSRIGMQYDPKELRGPGSGPAVSGGP